MNMYSRAYSNNDYESVRDFLNELYILNKNQHSWLMARWEYAEYFVSPLYTIIGRDNWISTMRLWINDDFKIVGIIHSEEPSEEAFIQIHPDYRHIEKEMINWAEKNIAFKTDDGTKKLVIHCHDGDEHREKLLKGKGYKKSDRFEYLKWQTLDKEIEDAKLPKGYSIHSAEDGIDVKKKNKCVVSAFNNEDYNEIEPDKEDISIFKSVENAPMYRKDLEIYTEDDNGDMASYALIWFNPVTKTGVYEPVATNNKHQRKGLGRAVIIEGLKRLKSLGAKIAYVGSADEKRSSFYKSAGFKEYDVYRKWVKEID
ncbi:MAG: GNAT family N-acetyltransferase [Firmicutes bacterium]|nr:GNAT family N-acetyltransferase [Bacillota bacterium]